VCSSDLVPDLTLLFVMDPQEGLARAGARGATDRIERSDAAFHARVADAFTTFTAPAWQEAHPECGPIVAIEGTGDEATVAARVRAVLRARIPAIATALEGRA
jgi:dTMP kinase